MKETFRDRDCFVDPEVAVGRMVEILVETYGCRDCLPSVSLEHWDGPNLSGEVCSACWRRFEERFKHARR